MKKMAKRLKFVAILLLAVVTMVGTIFASSAEKAGAMDSASAIDNDFIVVCADSESDSHDAVVAASKSRSSSEEGLAPWKIVLLAFAILLLVVSLCLKPVDSYANAEDEATNKSAKKNLRKNGKKFPNRFIARGSLGEADKKPATEEVVEEAPAEEPATEEIVEEAPAEEPVIEEVVEEASAEEPATEEVVEEAPAEEPVIEEVVEEAPTEEPVIEEVVEEAPAEEPATEEVVEEALAEEPATEEVVEEAPAEEPATEEVVEEAPAEEPATEEVVEEAPAEEPVIEEVVEEAPVEEPATEEVVEEASVEEIPVVATSEAEGETVENPAANGQVVMVSYRSSFMSRLIQAETDIQDYYTVIKNTLLSYKGVKARTSWNYESFNVARLQCAKLNIKGRTLSLYLALNPADYNASKYHFVDVSGKGKFDMVPMMLKVRSDRALKYAVELIEELMRVHGIEAGPAQNVDYHMPYETNEALAERDLVKVILPDGVTVGENDSLVSFDVSDIISASVTEGQPTEEVVVEEQPTEEVVVEEQPTEEVVVEEQPVEEVVVEEQPVEEVVTKIDAEIEDNLAHLREAMPDEAVVHVDAQHADELISDADAKSQIEMIEAPEAEQNLTGTKVCEINIDTICENFQEGETVELAKLIERGLVSKNAGKVKVLARGVMTKRLVVIADKYSIQAVKMITLAGGRAEQIGR